MNIDQALKSSYSLYIVSSVREAFNKQAREQLTTLPKLKAVFVARKTNVRRFSCNYLERKMVEKLSSSLNN